MLKINIFLIVLGLLLLPRTQNLGTTSPGWGASWVGTPSYIPAPRLPIFQGCWQTSDSELSSPTISILGKEIYCQAF